MKGKNQFTKDEFKKIEELISQKTLSTTSEQKGIRQKLRNLKFYCSDFDTEKNMTTETLNELLSTGDIIIKESNEICSVIKQANINAGQKNNNIKDGLPPMVGDSPKILILGTMPGDESLKEHAYYRNFSHNKFWDIIHSIFADETNISYEELLKKNHIALWDCIKRSERKGSTDNGFDKASMVPNDIERFLKENPTIKVIFLNGKSNATNSTKKIFLRFFKSLNSKYNIIPLDSTANTNSTISLEEKIKRWSVIRKYV